ncbi:MAG: glutamate 5-kinase [Lentisphaeria bacterium]|nr:glutamate 5-kinase [Lentisphaeria bacterium]MBO7154223.1 glutamate 5-kinase [Lentisphaeria bacterium]
MSVNNRRNAIENSRQIIVKAGTRLLIDRKSISNLVSGVAALRKSGRQVLLVTSGAVGMGMEVLGLDRRPKQLARKQALAAVGQSELMAIYSEECRKHGFACAQLLLTAGDLRQRSRYLNVMNCVNALWAENVLPIVNENDPVSVDELKFGDNDTLAGLLGSLTGAGLTILLTTVDGLRDRNADGSLGERIPEVAKLSDAVYKLAGGTDDANFSIGGMESKLRAANIVTSAGEYLWIADGRDSNVLQNILDAKDIGTLFLPSQNRLSGHKRFLTFFSKVSGKITVDAGAAEAVRKNGKSLLPSGVTAVSGDFKRGDTVEISGPDGVPFARGLINYPAADASRIMGLQSAEVTSLLGTSSESELIHRDHLTLLQ